MVSQKVLHTLLYKDVLMDNKRHSISYFMKDSLMDLNRYLIPYFIKEIIDGSY